MNLLILLAAATTPQPTELKTFQDWTVGCDNGRACHAVGLMPENMPEGAATMSVRRGPEAGALPEISFDTEVGAHAALAADGRRLSVRLVAGDSGPAVAAGDSGELIDALREARLLELIGRDGRKAIMSLAGASAALLYMDDQQRRIGTVTALVRRGPAPASSIPAPPPLPRVRSAAVPRRQGATLTKARIAALRRQAQCEIGEVGGPDEVETAAIDASRTLVLLACGSGAYNITHIPYIAERRGRFLSIRIAPFDVSPDWWDGRPQLINAGWDKEKGLLGTFSRGRGLGDCGTISEYAWDGRSFRLVEQLEMGECRGSMDYIATWRAEVVR